MTSPSNITVIFVLGGPGAGKGTQCSLLAKKYQLHHLSIGAMSRAEALKPNSAYAEIMQENISKGTLGPPQFGVNLLRDAVREHLEVNPRIKTFLVDGFPRDIDRARLFESTICKPAAVLFLNCPREILRERLLERGSAASKNLAIPFRSDDTSDVIETRFETFERRTSEVIKHYQERDMVVWIKANDEQATVFTEVEKAIGCWLVKQENQQE